MAAHVERHDLQRHVRVVGHLQQVLDLLAHDRGVAHRAAQHGLVQRGPQPRRAGPRQQPLAAHPQLDPPVQLVPADRRVAQLDDLAGVRRRLEQPGHELHLVVTDDRRGLLEADVRLEPVRQQVTEVVPPARVAGLAGQVEQALPVGGIGHAVQGEQVLDVPVLEADPAVLHPADLRMRATDGLRGLLGSDLPGLTESAELGSQDDPLDRRPARTPTEIPDRPLPGSAFGRAHRHPSVVDT